MSLNIEPFENIVSTDELGAHLDDPDWVIVDCRFNLMRKGAGLQAYEAGHIPGAVYADLDRDLASPVSADGAGGRHPLPDPNVFGQVVRNWGVGPASVIVVYDDSGNAVASRLWWLLRWIGHDRVAVLDGGLDAWVRAESPLTTDSPQPKPGSFVPRPDSMPVIDAESVQSGLSEDTLVVLDARSAERFYGQNEPLDRIAGHVPGAVSAPLTDNLDADKCFRPNEELEAYYRARIGDRPIDTVVCMCGSGVTACHTLLALESAGMGGAALYVGSWSDWISSGQRPVAGE